MCMCVSAQPTSSNDKIRQRVQNNYAAFITDVDPDRLSDYLKQEGIISIEQWQDICGKNTTPRCRCRAVLDFLLSGTHPRAFLVVRNVLEKENHHLLGEIDDNDSSYLTEGKKTIRNLLSLTKCNKASGVNDTTIKISRAWSLNMASLL